MPRLIKPLMVLGGLGAALSLWRAQMLARNERSWPSGDGERPPK